MPSKAMAGTGTMQMSKGTAKDTITKQGILIKQIKEAKFDDPRA